MAKKSGLPKEGAGPTVGAPEAVKPGRKPREVKPKVLRLTSAAEEALAIAARATGHQPEEAFALAEDLISDLLVPAVRSQLAERRKAAIEAMLAPPANVERGDVLETERDI